MKYKLPSNRKQIKFLKQLINTPVTYKTGFAIGGKFYKMFELTEEEVKQILNALDSKGLIKMYPPNDKRQFAYIEVSQKAFAYIPDLRDNLFRFWIPIILSSALSIAAIIISTIALVQQTQAEVPQEKSQTELLHAE